MKESGVTTRIVDSWLYGRPDEIVDRIFIEDASSLGYCTVRHFPTLHHNNIISFFLFYFRYDNLFFPQMILGFGMMFSLAIFLVERCITWMGKRSSVLQLGSDFVGNIEFASSSDEHLFGSKDSSPVIGFQ